MTTSRAAKYDDIMTQRITQVMEEKRQLQAALAIVDVIFEIVDAIREAAAVDEELRFFTTEATYGLSAL